MNDDEFARRLRPAEGPAMPDPRFADRLYLELATELGLPSARPRVAARAQRRAHPRLSLLAAALLLLALAVAAAIVGSQLLVRPSVVPADLWQGFGGDATRRGEAARGPTASPVLRWRFQASGAIPGSVAVAGDHVYAASDNGVLYAIDLATGVERWRFVSDQPPLRAPVVDADRVLVFDGVGILHAVDAITGLERCHSTTPVRDPSDPAIGDGVVYAGSGDGSLVAIDTADGTERWRIPISARGAAYAPAVADGRVFVAADGGGFVAVDADDGKLAWRLDTGDLPMGTAAVADGLAYVGASTIKLAGMLRAVDASTGRERWRVEKPILAPAISQGVAVAGSVDLGVRAFDAASGDQQWAVGVDGWALPPVVAEGLVYVPLPHEQRIRALDATTGTERWRFDVDAMIPCCIAVADGAVFVSTDLGGVYAIDGREDLTAPKD